MDKSVELRQQRAAMITEAREVLDNENVTAEDEARFDTIMAEADKLKAKIDRIERLEDEEAGLEETIDRRADVSGISHDEAAEQMRSEDTAFVNYLRVGMGGLSAEERTAMMDRQHSFQGALSVGTDTAGGFTVPEGFLNRLESAMKAYGGVREVAEVLQTSTGNDLPIPTSNDTNNKGAILAENAAVSEQDTDFGAVTLQSFMYTSKLIKVSLQLLQDSGVDIEARLATIIGERIARITNEHFTVGDGSSKPRGIVTAAPVGVTAASATALTSEELIDLEHSVNRAYRQNANFMFADSTLKVLKKLEDSNGLPLWLPGIASREPDTLLGYGYVINDDVAAIATGEDTITFGDHSKYMIRDVAGAQVLRLNERYADNLQVGFFGFKRHDGDLIDAGTNPVKKLRMG